MNERTTSTITTLSALAVIGFAIWVFYRLALHVVDAFAALDPKYGATLVAATGTIVVSVISVVGARWLESRALIRKEHREKKIPVYEDLLQFMFKVFMGTKTGNAPTEEEMIQFMSDFNQRSMVWASDDVLKAWIQFRSESIDDQNPNPYGIMFAYEDLIRAIRKDLGHKNSGLTKGKILSLFVNDLGDYLDENGNLLPTAKE